MCANDRQSYLYYRTGCPVKAPGAKTAILNTGMKKKPDKNKKMRNRNIPSENINRQGEDKAPGEEQGKAEQVTGRDLKGKKIDADPSQETGRPAE